MSWWEKGAWREGVNEYSILNSGDAPVVFLCGSYPRLSITCCDVGLWFSCGCLLSLEILDNIWAPSCIYLCSKCTLYHIYMYIIYICIFWTRLLLWLNQIAKCICYIIWEFASPPVVAPLLKAKVSNSVSPQFMNLLMPYLCRPEVVEIWLAWSMLLDVAYAMESIWSCSSSH